MSPCQNLLRARIRAFNRAAHYSHWCVLVDLDHDAPCAAALRDEWLPSRAELLRFRIAVREIEAWLLADRHRVAQFLGVAQSRMPLAPELEDSPKQVMVNLARRSHRRAISEDMVPRPGSGRTIGVGYTCRLIEFASDRNGGCRPDVAAASADSLGRCITRLREFL